MPRGREEAGGRPVQSCRPTRRAVAPGCSLLEKVFQRFALQSVQPDIFLVIITKGLWSKKQDIKIFW